MTKVDKRKTEDAMKLVEHELNSHKQMHRDHAANDSREIVNLQQKVNDKDRQMSSLEGEV